MFNYKITSSVVLTSYILLDSNDNKDQVEVIYTDFKKIIDTLDHVLLMNELKAYSVGNPFLSRL